MGPAFRKYEELREKYLKNEYGGTNAERIARSIKRAGLSLAVLATFAHRTKLEGGVVKVHFVRNFLIDLKEEITVNGLLQELVGRLVYVSEDSNETLCDVRHISGSSRFPLKKDAERQALESFLADPMSAVPDELKDEVREGLAKKAKSISKRVRNYDNETVRRARGRKSRAVTSLTKVLAELDPDQRLVIVKAIRLNRIVPDDNGWPVNSLRKLYMALHTVLSGNNLENWQDEDVIPEAVRLADVQAVMDQ